MSNNIIMAKKQKIAFITGVTGQDSSYLAELLLEKNYKVIGLRRRTSTFNTERVDHLYSNPNFIMEWGNVTDAFCLYSLLRKYKPDEIYHLAAQSHVKVSFEVPEETVDVICMGTLRLLNAVKEICPNAKVYNAASSEMYGDNPEVPQNELTRFMPASPYACAKTFGFNICRNYREAYGMHISSGILFNHESPRRGETFVTRKIVQAAVRIANGKQEILELGNLNASRDWGHAKSYVKAMWLMLQQEKPDDYVIASGKTYTVSEFLHLVFDKLSLDVEKHVRINPKYFRPHEVPFLLGDAGKAKKVLGWENDLSLEDLVDDMIKEEISYLKNKNEI